MRPADDYFFFFFFFIFFFFLPPPSLSLPSSSVCSFFMFDSALVYARISFQKRVQDPDMIPLLGGGSCEMKLRPGLPFRSAIAMK